MIRRRRNNKGLLILGGITLAAFAGRALAKRLRQADLGGRVAVITGGSRGLGLLLAREFAREGCRIVIGARDELELDRARAELEAMGADVLTVTCDLSDPEQARKLIRDALGHFGQVDILVNNAGIIQVGPVQSMTIQDFERAMDVMFWGAVHPIMEAMPHMLQRKTGHIVNITSIGGKVSVPHLLPYNCAKFAMVGLSEGLRAELKSAGIRVVTIVPGLMRTGSFLNAFFKGDQKGEFTWFSMGAALPFVSMDARRAARQIVRATKRGESERILSTPATLLARFHGVFPGLTTELLALVNRMVLPSAEGGTTELARGMDIKRGMQSRLLDAVTRLGSSSAERYNEIPGSARA